MNAPPDWERAVTEWIVEGTPSPEAGRVIERGRADNPEQRSELEVLDDAIAGPQSRQLVDRTLAHLEGKPPVSASSAEDSARVRPRTLLRAAALASVAAAAAVLGWSLLRPTASASRAAELTLASG